MLITITKRRYLANDYSIDKEQSERDKTVAGNEGGSGRPSVGVELPWCQFAADRLATSLRETHLHLGVSRTNRDASIIKPDTRRSMETENCLCSPDLKNFLVFGCYIGGMYLPKF